VAQTKEQKLARRKNRRKQSKMAGFCTEHPLRPVVFGHTMCEPCLEDHRVKSRQRYKNLKISVLEHYGKACVCCGEDHFEFLSIEHSRGDGQKHSSKKIKMPFYCWLKKKNFPQDLGLTVLCFNCNCAKGFSGYCPHEREKNGQ